MNCETCRYAHKSDRQVGTYECRRHPPVMAPIPQGGSVGMLAMRPMVQGDNWCGEFLPRLEPGAVPDWE